MSRSKRKKEDVIILPNGLRDIDYRSYLEDREKITLNDKMMVTAHIVTEMKEMAEALHDFSDQRDIISEKMWDELCVVRNDLVREKEWRARLESKLLILSILIGLYVARLITL